jgi:hypothetical protein
MPLPPRDPVASLHEPADEERAQYRPLCGWAVAAAVLGGLSVVALVDPLGWILPAAGVAAGLAALGRIARNAEELSGRTLAWAGLGLSLFFAAATPAEWLTYRGLLRGEARQFAAGWFALLRDDQPQMAHQLTLPPDERQPLDGPLWKIYREVPELRQMLVGYVEDRLVRTLLALGRQADVRFYSIEDQERLSDRDLLAAVYAVSYQERGQKKTFFLRLHLARLRRSRGKNWLTGHANWQLVRVEGGIRPSVFPGG